MIRKKIIERCSVMAVSLVALVMVSCNRDMVSLDIAEDIEPATKDIPEHVVTFKATLPADNGNETKTRLCFKDNNGGIKTEWEELEDKLHLFLERDNNSSETCQVVAIIKSVDESGRTAEFETKLPEKWCKGNCNVYGILLRTSPKGSPDQPTQPCKIIKLNNQDYFQVNANEALYSSYHKSNPILWFKHENFNIGEASNMQINLQHCGYLVAMHINNTSNSSLKIYDVNLYAKDSKEFFFPKDDIDINVKTGHYMKKDRSGSYFLKFADRDRGNVVFATIKRNTTDVLYHWLPYFDDKMEFPALQKVSFDIPSIKELQLDTEKKQIEKGKVYHFYLEWDGGKFKRESRN